MSVEGDDPMKYIGKKSMAYFVRLLLQVIMGITIIVLIALPWIINEYLAFIRLFINDYARTVLLIVLYPCGISALIVENELRKMFNSLVDKDPFIQRNVRSLNTMGISMLVILVMLIVKVLTLNSIMTMLLCIASGILAIFCFILADVFNQAVVYKEEHDLTI